MPFLRPADFFDPGMRGMTRLHEQVADHLGDDGEPRQVLVGIETDRGPGYKRWPRPARGVLANC